MEERCLSEHHTANDSGPELASGEESVLEDCKELVKSGRDSCSTWPVCHERASLRSPHQKRRKSTDGRKPSMHCKDKCDSDSVYHAYVPRESMDYYRSRKAKPHYTDSESYDSSNRSKDRDRRR